MVGNLFSKFRKQMRMSVMMNMRLPDICISPFTGRVLRSERTARKYGYLFFFFFADIMARPFLGF